MIRIKNSTSSTKKRHKYVIAAKGYKKQLSTFAHEQVIQSLYFQYVSRRLNKRYFRMLWIIRINTALHEKKQTYSTFLGSLRKLNIFINRKMLAYLIFCDLALFNALIRLFN